jgi:hypothetical protein
MLREDKRAGFTAEGALLWRRYRFGSGGLVADPIRPRRLARTEEHQREYPCPVMQDGGRRWWWFHDRFYWEDDLLAVEDVMALVVERERGQRRKLERAHAAMHHDGAAGPRRQPIPRDVRLAVWQRDGGRCVECRGAFDLQYDHVIPFSMGGASTAENLQLLCAVCNRVKGAWL